MNFLLRAFLPMLAITIAFSAGCTKKSEDPALGVIFGKVTLKGESVTGGRMNLHPKEDTAKKVSVNLRGDGTFESTEIPVGEMLVSFDTESVKSTLASIEKQKALMPDNMPKMFSPEGVMKDKNSGGKSFDMTKDWKYVPIPEKYQDPQKSGFTVTIRAGRQEKDFKLD